MSFCSPLKLKQHNVAKTENTVLRCKTKNVSRNIHEYPFVTTSWHLALFLLLNILRFPAAPILKEVNAYSAIYSSEMQIAKAACGGKQQFNCLSPNYVSYCKTAAHLSEIKKEEGRGEEKRGVGGEKRWGRWDRRWWGERWGKGGDPRRQMPPLWPWHCWILIVQSHIVPTLLEMWALSCCASVTR